MSNKTRLQQNNSELNEIYSIASNLPEGQKVIIDGAEYKQDLSLITKYTDIDISTLPYNFSRGCAVVLNNEIHILGGADGIGYGQNHYKWGGLSWTSVSTLPLNFFDSSAVLLNDEIHILGAGNQYKNHYKWDGNSWIDVGMLPYGFRYGSAVVLNNKIHILGSSEDPNAHYELNAKVYKEIV